MKTIKRRTETKEIEEIENEWTIEKIHYMWKLNSTLLNINFFLKQLETSKNENTLNQNLKDVAKAILRGKCINAYIKKKKNLRVPIVAQW